jgi:hypothetical protein
MQTIDIMLFAIAMSLGDRQPPRPAVPVLDRKSMDSAYEQNYLGPSR